MNTAIDLDGVITNKNWYKGRLWLPWWFILCGLVVLERFILSRRGIVDFRRDRRKQGDRIIIISARPKNSPIRLITKRWLARYNVPYNKLILVGVGRRLDAFKSAAIKKEKVVFYLDDDRKTVNYLNGQLERVKVYCFGAL